MIYIIYYYILLDYILLDNEQLDNDVLMLFRNGVTWRYIF